MDIQTPRIDELKKKVSSYTDKKSIIPDILYSNKIYTVIPVFVLALLIIFRPNFLYIENTDKKGNTEKKFSFQKLVSFWLFFSLIISVGLFGYRYKNKQ